MRFKDEDASPALVGAACVGRLLLGSVVSLITPSLASAAVTIAITTPPPGQSVTNPVTITVTYSSSGPALDLASFRAHVNGADWTSRFEVGPGSASYILSPADQLIAGPLTIQAEIRDTATPPALGQVTESYDVLPSLQAVSPSTVVESGRLTLGVLGLDPDPADNELVFPSLFGGEATAPFISVDRDLNQGVADLPDGAMTGPLRVRVNDRTSPQSLDVTVLPAYLGCGTIYRFHSLPNGRFLVLYASIFPFPPPGCPTSVPAGRRAAVLLYPEGTSVTLATGYASGGFIRQVEEIAVDKTGQYMAVILRENEPTERLFIQYRNRTTSIPLPGPRIPGPHITAHPIAADFDVDGNLYIAVLDPQTHLVRIPAAALAVGGSVVPELVADGLDVRNTPGCADGLHLVVSCDGHAYVAIQNHLNSLHPPGMCPSDEWMRWNQGIIRKIDLATGAVVSDLNTDNGFMYDIVHTCRTDEIFGVTYTDYNYPVPGDVWRSVEGGPPSPVFHMPFLTAEALTIGPTGKVYISWWESPRRYLLSIPYRVEDCQGCGPGEPCPALSAPQPYCLSPLLYPIRIRPETTRWRPQRSTTGTVEVHFDGPQGLTPQTTLLISGPNGALTGQTLAFEVVDGQSDPARYKITWSGPWTAGSPPAYLPRGNYRARVQGVLEDDSLVFSSASDPNGTVSLVEVTSVEIEPTSGGAALDNNPAVPLHPDEPADQVAGRRMPRPGGGFRIFAEAPGPDLLVSNQVRVRITITPIVDRDVTVSLRAIDVDDPDSAPIDKDSDSGVVNDNYGTAQLAETLTVPANATSAETTLTVCATASTPSPCDHSPNPGDNYRVGASTSEAWLDAVTAYQPSQVGEVRAADDVPLVEGTVVSKMLTVWRTLNLEIDSMQPAPSDPGAAERNFVEGLVERITEDSFVPTFAGSLILAPVSPPEMDRLRDKSADRSGGPGQAVPLGDGRFQSGTIRLGPEQTEHRVLQNGIDYIEATMAIWFQRLSIDGETLVKGTVVSGQLDTGVFRLYPRQGSWEQAQADAFFLTISGVTWPIPEGGVGLLEQYPGGYAFGEVITGANRVLPFRLVDDDKAVGPYQIDTSLLQDTDSPLSNAFAAAYIRPGPCPRRRT